MGSPVSWLHGAGWWGESFPVPRAPVVSGGGPAWDGRRTPRRRSRLRRGALGSCRDEMRCAQRRSARRTTCKKYPPDDSSRFCDRMNSYRSGRATALAALDREGRRRARLRQAAAHEVVGVAVP
ncbi:hypothetical protein GCM10012285_22550 [Streptomyces kronopolitis]|uniref:Uncharacterized protein n=1 Tax=Streptomyces kronopolitis TaxID=1612435 RepID=A0ABQ2JBB0_9ACTN|nr:hypothetical protein GCM10012285_22550 [Streptomyces kronopolitis]